LLNNPSDHTNKGCGIPGRPPCGGYPGGNGGGAGARGGRRNLKDHLSSSSGFSNSGSATSNPLSDLLNNYNYAVGAQTSLFESHTPTFDVVITEQASVIYSNGSNTTVSLSPLGIRQAFPHENGLSSNFTVNPDLEFTSGYGQSLAGDALSSLTGLNLNPINGELTSRVAISSGPATVQSSLRVQATFRPAETGLAAAGAAVAALLAIPGPLDEAAAGGAIIKLCAETQIC